MTGKPPRLAADTRLQPQEAQGEPGGANHLHRPEGVGGPRPREPGIGAELPLVRTAPHGHDAQRMVPVNRPPQAPRKHARRQGACWACCSLEGCPRACAVGQQQELLAESLLCVWRLTRAPNRFTLQALGSSGRKVAVWPEARPLPSPVPVREDTVASGSQTPALALSSPCSTHVCPGQERCLSCLHWGPPRLPAGVPASR